MLTKKIVLKPMFITFLFSCLVLGPFSTFGQNLSQEKKKIFVVMSYDLNYTGESLIKSGIEEILEGEFIRYFYLDTKKNLEKGPKKAQLAYELYKKFNPDVIITVDDHAQSLFAVPYIKDKEKTPVVFCGVNDDASQYGYPTSQITGILEKKHYKQSLEFAKLILPEISKIAVIYKDNTSNRANVSQIEKEKSEYAVEVAEFIAIENIPQLSEEFGKLEKRVDALLVLNLAGITSYGGVKMGTIESMTYVSENWPKATIGASKREIQAGLLCAIAKINKEQGLVAGQMAKDILSGTPVELLPVTENRNGMRMINSSTAKRLGIKLTPLVLAEAELIN